MNVQEAYKILLEKFQPLAENWEKSEGFLLTLYFNLYC